jgi:hypothetical protein
LIQKKQNRSHNDALPLRYMSACSFRSKVTFFPRFFRALPPAGYLSAG